LKTPQLPDLQALNPSPADKKNTEEKWADDQIYKAIRARLLRLQRPGQETYPHAKDYFGPKAPPPIDQYQQLKRVVVRFVDPAAIYQGWQKFKDAVQLKIDALNNDPDLKQLGYTFSAEYPTP
jgi:hypothetical protein